MAFSASLTIFIIFIIILVICLIIFVFYMNSWLCFSKIPKIWCLSSEYEELESAPVSEVDVESSVKSVLSKPHSDKVDFPDDVTIAAVEAGLGVDGNDEDKDSDVSDEKVKMFGQITASFNHQMRNNTLIINISRVDNLPSKSEGGTSEYEICIALFSDHNEKLGKTWHSPRFQIPYQTNSKILSIPKFEYPELSQKDLSQTAVRFRLYGCERRIRNILLGETIVGLCNVKFQGEGRPPYNIQLECRASLKHLESNQARESLDKEFSQDVSIRVENTGQLSAELFVGLGYNPITGRLTIEVVKGNSLYNPLSKDNDKMPNSFVKITLSVNNSQEIEKTKTTVRRNQANPLFKEKFMFHLPQFQLEEVTVMIAVYHRKSMTKKELIGWFSLGRHNSSDEENSHWQNMLSADGQMVHQTHLLQLNSKSRSGVPGAS